MNMENPVQPQENNNNNQQRFDNPYNLDPENEDICIERKLERDIFCPLMAVSTTFGEQNDYYSMRAAKPLKESFFHVIQSFIFPNLTLFQFSAILCYINLLMFIIVLCFGIDKTNSDIFLQVRLSIIDAIGSFYPLKIKKNILNYYRLFTFHFLHFNFAHICLNIFSLITYCSFFELLVKKYLFIILFFLSGILSSIASIAFFQKNERFVGMNGDLSGIFGAFMMFFVMNWEEGLIIFGPTGRFLVAYLVALYIFLSFVYFQIMAIGNISVELISLPFGALLFAVLVKPIKVKRWKTYVRIAAGAILFVSITTALISFYLRDN